MQIAFIDFDGTLTKKDSFLQFMKFISPAGRYFFGLVYISFWLLIFFSGIISRQHFKEKVLQYFVKGMSASEVESLSEKFTRDVVPMLLTERAKMLLGTYRKKKVQIVIVTASLDIWMESWCRQQNIGLICTHAEVKNNKLTGKLSGKNCHGPEKASQIQKYYQLSAYSKIFTHGDSRHDKEMLELGTDSFYKWKKIKP